MRGALAHGNAASQCYLLLLRFTVLNLVALALLGAAWIKRRVSTVLSADVAELVLVIGAVFLFGLLSCDRKIWHTQAENWPMERHSESTSGSRVGSVHGIAYRRFPRYS